MTVNFYDNCEYIRVNENIDNDLKKKSVKLTPNMSHLFNSIKQILHSKVFEINYAMRVNYHLKTTDDKLSIIACMDNQKDTNDVNSVMNLIKQQSKPLLKINLDIENGLLHLNNIQVNLRNIQGDDWSLFTYLDDIVWAGLLPFTKWFHPNRVINILELLYTLYSLSYYSRLFGKYKTLYIDTRDTHKLKTCVSGGNMINSEYKEFIDEYKSAFNTPTSLGVSFNHEDPLVGKLISIAKKYGIRKQGMTTVTYIIENRLDYKYKFIVLSLYKDYNYGVMLRSFYEGKELLVPKSVVENVIKQYTST